MAGRAQPVEEAEIRERIDAFERAIRAKDLEGVLSLYAPDIRSFDLGPPLQYLGTDAYRKPWEDTFVSFEGPIGYEVRDLGVTAAGELAFSYSLNQMSGTLESGQEVALWVRWTACFQRINGRWLIVHEQVSVPVDLDSGRALLDLEPPTTGAAGR
jgi:ketosteroid isomerase-like protein